MGDDPAPSALPNDIEQKLIDGRHLRATTYDLAASQNYARSSAPIGPPLTVRTAADWEGGTD
jgi:hypothetical protein